VVFGVAVGTGRAEAHEKTRDNMELKELKVGKTPLHSDTLPNNAELSRLITAAVVNREFCHLLLANPALALATGYSGESFRLAVEEQELVLSIRATSLADFAMQLARDRNGNGRNGHGNGVERKVSGLK
jgi:hypothetical protein